MAEDSLEPLITQCPTCRTRFRVTEAQLNVAAGRVRCGACLSVFKGIEHLVLGAGPRLRPGESPNEALDALLDELRADTTVTKPESHDDASAPGAVDVSDRVRPPEDSLGGESGRHAESDAADAAFAGHSQPRADAETVAGARDDSPRGGERADDAAARVDGDVREPHREARLRTPAATQHTDAPADAPPPAAVSVALTLSPEDLMEPRRRKRRWWIPVVVLVGVVALAAQVLYLQFDAWAKDPDIRPIYEWLCPRLHCQLPVMRSLDDIRSKNLVVRDDPDHPGQLTVDALIVNQAPFAQPFPVIELRFSSMDGRPLAALRFRPQEYLAGELKGATTFAPLTPVHIAFQIPDPGAEAVSYYIQFR